MIHPEEDRLDLFLDRLATDPAHDFTPNGEVSEATFAARSFHALDAGDRGTDPQPAFLGQL